MMTDRVQLNRRNFLGATATELVGTSLVGSFHPRVLNAGEETPEAAPEEQAIQPYDPAIKRRVVFIHWRHVNPGWFGWMDEKGQGHGTGESFDPGALRFQPTNSPQGIRIVAQPAQRRGPIIQPQRPWETAGIWLLTVFYEKGIYRGWVLCSPGWPEGVFTYFESKDGLNWDRPNLGLVERDGNRDNNVLPLQFNGNREIFIDPVAPEAERYKMVIGDQPGGVHGAVSPDGLHWKRLPEPIIPGDSDTQHVGYYDQPLGKYVVYTRMNVPDGRRAIGRAESGDFRKFPPSEVVLETRPDMPPSVDLYTNCKTTIPGAPDHHLMFPTVYHRECDLGEPWIASSPDGKVWSFLEGSPVLTPTPVGQWGCGWTVPSPNLIELPDGSFALPFHTTNLPHKYPRGQLRYSTGYAFWPKGRIVALEAEEYGQFTTTALATGGGRKLRINAVTKRAGSIRVEVAGQAGRSIADCKPIIGDHYRTVVSWNGQDDLGHKENAAVVLRFQMNKARIFGLEFV